MFDVELANVILIDSFFCTSGFPREVESQHYTNMLIMLFSSDLEMGFDLMLSWSFFYILLSQYEGEDEDVDVGDLAVDIGDADINSEVEIVHV